MFDEHMRFTDGDEVVGLTMSVYSSRRLPMVFQYWMAEVSRDILRLGVFFRSAGVMLQVPGAAALDWDSDDEAEMLMVHSERGMLCNALAEALERLGVKHLMDQLDELECVEDDELTDEWRDLLKLRQGQKHGLTNLIALLLDHLVLYPGMKEIDTAAEPHWWHCWKPE